ncbi:MAG: ABC transporter permease [Bacteroidetes bacterium]|nr:ABC transporter permease [Bacteroidota bacterium]MDA1224823.1 ABC transporter permease [Bacteroidota bacterium]
MSMFAENIKQGLGSVKAHATRAVITSSIIAIGIAALVGILTSISAMQIAVTKTFSKMGSQSFTIKNAGGVKRYGEVDDNTRLTFDEAWEFQKRMEGRNSTVALSINADFAAKASFQSAETNPNVRVIGIDEDYLKTAYYELGAGRTFTDNEVTRAVPVVVVGQEIVDKLFPGSDKMGRAINQVIAVNGKPYRVVGSLQTKGSSMGMSGGDRVIFVPITRAKRDMKNMQDNCMINVAVDKVLDLDESMSEAYTLMRRIKRLKPGEDENFVIQQSTAMAKEALENIKMVSGVGTVIAIITLLGAAVSLMNIMLVSVTERTREIGLRKALGATAKQIKNQFLIEAVVICQIGGAGGILLGLIIGNLVGVALGAGFVAPWEWMLLAVVVCIVVGLGAGLYPASRASRLDPIEALRFD